MIALLDRQHFGKPNRNDLGAGVDLDGDGKVEAHEMEANLTPLYIDSARQHLESCNQGVIVEDRGTYVERHHRANIFAGESTNQVGYVACHLNAGGGDYAAVFHDARSAGGKRLAEEVAKAMRELDLPAVKRVLVKPAKSSDWTKNALYTIKGIYSGPSNISAICFEPLFVDNKEHQKLLTPEGLQWIGIALAQGIMRWGIGKGATV